jgi:hypothetical protein
MPGRDRTTPYDMAIGELADDYAELLDPKYRIKKEKGEPIEPLVEDLRGIFFRMIIVHDPTDFRLALTTICSLDTPSVIAAHMLSQKGFPTRDKIEAYMESTLPLGQIAGIIAQADKDNILHIIDRPDRMVRLQMFVKKADNYEFTLTRIVGLLLEDRHTSFEELMASLK